MGKALKLKYLNTYQDDDEKVDTKITDSIVFAIGYGIDDLANEERNREVCNSATS